MRPGQNQRRGGRRNDNRHGGGSGQHRNNNNQQGQQRSAASLRNQIFDSNGPDTRVRGNAFQVYEKYQALAKDALSSGDRVLAENYLQHAEHYYRIIEAINEATAAEQRARQAAWENQPQPGAGQYHEGNYQSQGSEQQPQDGNAHPLQADGFTQQDGQQQHQHQQRRRDHFQGNRHQQRPYEQRSNETAPEGEAAYNQQQPQAQQPASQDPLYDGVDEDANDSPDTQAAVAGRR